MRRAAALAAVLVAASALVAGASSAPGHACASANELSFRAADGTRLVGHRFGGKRPGARTVSITRVEIRPRGNRGYSVSMSHEAVGVGSGAGARGA